MPPSNGKEQLALAAIGANDPNAPVAICIREVGNPLPIRRPGRQTFDTGIACELPFSTAIRIYYIQIPTATGRTWYTTCSPTGDQSG